jgi:AcrR family transcriptional regulator
MGRRSTFSDEQVFSAVSAQVAASDHVKIQDLVKATGISIGSLYHRYSSREGLLAATWLDALQTFHAMFLAALDGPGAEAGEQAALATPRFARQHRDRAIVLCLGRSETLMAEDAPAEFLTAADEANKRVKRALEAFSDRQNISLQACMHGLVAFPLASVKLYLPHARVPGSVDGFVKAAYHAAVQADRRS